MTAEVTAPDSIIVALNNIVSPRKNSKAIIFGAITSIVGVAIFTVSRMISVDYPILYMLLATVGILVIITGVIRMVAAKRQYRIKSNGQPVELVSFYYDAAEFNQIKQRFEKADFKGISAMRHGDNGGVRLDFCTSRDTTFVAMQLYHYVPYTFEPASDVCVIEGMQAQDICKMLMK